MDEDVALLADAKGPVGRLVLHRRIPPTVEVDDMGSSGEVEPGAAGLEGKDEERRAVVALETLDHGLAGLDGGAAVKDEPAAPKHRGKVSFEGLG